MNEVNMYKKIMVSNRALTKLLDNIVLTDSRGIDVSARDSS